VVRFSDLYEQFSQKYTGCTICFYKLGTDEVVGSDDELFFAYEDVQSKLLELELRVHRLTKKRSIDNISEADFDEPSEVSITSQQWTNSEMALFDAGVRLHGWGKWKSIAGEVRTRNVQAVRGFSRTLKGKRFNYGLS
jgi:hypothetical protein